MRLIEDYVALCALLASATAHLVSRVSEHLDDASVAFTQRVEGEGLSKASLIDAGRVLGLAEVIHASASDIVQLALEEANYGS